jgi:hypothetical protein
VIAYVFWHRRSPGIDDRSYADLLRRFHRILAAHPTPGFLGSYSYRLSAAPWLPGHETAYEDWYLLENSAAIDPLNDGAVSAPRQADHDQVAMRAGSGSGGLYRLRRGNPELQSAAFTAWFAKPEGMTYDQLYAALEPVIARESAALWGRQMVLGAAPEFCLQAREPIHDLPRFDPLGILLELVHPRSGG